MMSLDSVPSFLKTVVVLLTDGEPTDKSPSQVREIAAQLDAPLYTIRVNHQGKSQEERRDSHFKTINRYYQNWTTDDYASLDDYVDDLMVLGKDISKSGFIEIGSAQQLETAIFEDILKVTIPCLNDDEKL